MSGIARSSLIVLAPVRSGSWDQLLAALGALDDGRESPFALVPGTHFARWVLVPALTGPGDARLDAEGSFLLMCADFDTTLAQWSASLCERAGAELGPIMDCWEGFPGCGDPRGVTAFLGRHNVRAGFTIAGYRPATVTEVRTALALQDELRDLALRAQHLDPGALRREWNAVMGR